ncbi:MAG: T9SS type A sorting domain-containing protein [Bacteroidales bacterium]|nr:T9SS type A sorting domain-containing protein [Bacteroidales bacterium]
MKHTQIKRKELKFIEIAALLLFACSFSTITAQTSINAVGGNTSDTGGTISYSVGQVFYTSNTGTTGSTTQGVQQVYEILEETALEKTKGINLSVSAYPNPTTNYLTLEIKDFDISNLHFQLYDINGKLLQNQKIINNQTNIIMHDLVPATYFIKVIQENKEVKTFRIIKN